MNTASSLSKDDESSDLQHYYPNFSPAEVPSGTSAWRAWIGSIQPFNDDQCARFALRALDQNQPVEIDRGAIRAIAYPKASHPFEKSLTSMEVRFQLLLLEFAPPEHPRVYGLKPRVSWYTFPAHPHLRGDQEIEYGGAVLPALCVYSAADFRYLRELPLLVEFLDQTATFLAKQLIWMRTRRLFDFETGRLIREPSAGNLVLDVEPRTEDTIFGVSRVLRRPTRVWKGYWPGSAAPVGAAAHIATINPSSECWCGRGRPYRDCHLPYEKQAAKAPACRN